MKVSNSVLEELIVKHKGFVTQICKAAGISRQTFYNRIEKNVYINLNISGDSLFDFNKRYGIVTNKLI